MTTLRRPARNRKDGRHALAVNAHQRGRAASPACLREDRLVEVNVVLVVGWLSRAAVRFRIHVRVEVREHALVGRLNADQELSLLTGNVRWGTGWILDGRKRGSRGDVAPNKAQVRGQAVRVKGSNVPGASPGDNVAILERQSHLVRVAVDSWARTTSPDALLNVVVHTSQEALHNCERLPLVLPILLVGRLCYKGKIVIRDDAIPLLAKRNASLPVFDRMGASMLTHGNLEIVARLDLVLPLDFQSAALGQLLAILTPSALNDNFLLHVLVETSVRPLPEVYDVIRNREMWVLPSVLAGFVAGEHRHWGAHVVTPVERLAQPTGISECVSR